MIREVEVEVGRPIGIPADLQGPKLRCGTFANGPVMLEVARRSGSTLDPAEGDVNRVRLPHPEIFAALEVGSTLLVNDGKIRLRVVDCSPDHNTTTVEVGGEISNRKGVNVPDVVLPLAALSNKDRSDPEFACELGVDWLALSFVQRASDVRGARARRRRAAILSKIEKPAAVKAFAEILDASDGIMVARGDLGVELPVYEVPPIQKRLTRACRAVGKPVIVATQMMEHDHRAGPDARRSVGRRRGPLRGGGRGDAVGRIGFGRLSDRSGLDDEQRGDLGRERHELSAGDRSRARRAASGFPNAITVAAREVAETTQVKAICCFVFGHHGAISPRANGRACRSSR